MGLVVRLAWTIIASGTPDHRLNDAGEYVRVAEQLADGDTPTIAGRPTAFIKPGYPAALVPVVWASRLSGGRISTQFGAGLLNVALGTTTIGLSAIMARQWLGARAAGPTAWLVALCPPAIFVTSPALAETLITFLGVAVIVLATSVAGSRADSGRPAWKGVVAIGVLIGFGSLVRGNGLVLLPVVVLVLRGRTLRQTLVTASALIAVVAAVLTPWAIRNRIEVGVGAPLSTGNASSLCLAYRNGATGLPDFSEEALRDCYTRSPYDDRSLYVPGDPHVYLSNFDAPDEVAWYRRTTRQGIAWALHHPGDVVTTNWNKTLEVFRTTQGALAAADDGSDRLSIDAAQHHAANIVGKLWLWTVTTLAIAGGIALHTGRRAYPIWLTPLLMLISVWGGVGLDRYQIPMVPFLASLAAAVLVATTQRINPSSPRITRSETDQRPANSPSA